MPKNNKNVVVQKPPRNFKFYLGSRERYITISSDFQSGNIGLIRQLSQFQYRLTSVHDGTYTDNYVNSKSWFYFSIVGFPKNTKGKFLVTKVNTLSSIFYSKNITSYRPVYKVGDGGQWLRLPSSATLIMRQNGQLQCVFEYIFTQENEKVYFAFAYPYQYKKNIKLIQDLSQYLYHDDFYYHQEVMIKSPENRFIHLLTITSYDHRDKNIQEQLAFDQKLFPENNRPHKFNKPVVLLSARVHPGETAASFAMQGVLKFLTDKNDLRAHLLRKMFVFMVVPMINVDGVYHGHFRMDGFGKNLNRFYINPDPHKQPAVYGIKQLADHLTLENRLALYIDFHAHNAKKGHFIYGNAINDFVQQVQSQVFCKLISMNSKGFQYNYCNFSQKHMKAKDRFEDMTKEGCGRVVMYRLANIIHSYSLQCGIISARQLNTLPPPMNTQFTLGSKIFTNDEYQNNQSLMYKTKGQQNPLFTPQMYYNLGKNIMVSILDVFDKNPYNRVYNSRYKSMDMLRRLTAFQIFHDADRFRMFERFVFGKVKKINELIRQVLNTKLHYKKLYNFYFYDDTDLKNAIWPSNISGLNKPRVQSPSKVRKLKSVTSEIHKLTKQYSESFVQTLANVKNNESLGQLQEGMLINQQKVNSESQSSETQDYSPLKAHRQQFAFDESQNQQYFEEQMNRQEYMKFTDTYADMNVRQQQNLNNIERINSNYELNKNCNLSQYDKVIKLSKVQQDIQRQQKKDCIITSLRVRRLLKQDIKLINKIQLQSKNITQDINRNKEQSITIAQQFRKNIYSSIKQQIRQGLKRQEQRKTQINLGSIPIELHGNISVISDRKRGGRIKCWSVKKPAQKNISRLQLPSLGSQMFIISTSTKLINKRI